MNSVIPPNVPSQRNSSLSFEAKRKHKSEDEISDWENDKQDFSEMSESSNSVISKIGKIGGLLAAGVIGYMTSKVSIKKVTELAQKQSKTETFQKSKAAVIKAYKEEIAPRAKKVLESIANSKIGKTVIDKYNKFITNKKVVAFMEKHNIKLPTKDSAKDLGKKAKNAAVETTSTLAGAAAAMTAGSEMKENEE